MRVWPHLGLAIQEWPDLVRHFEREYGPSAAADVVAPDSIRLVISSLDGFMRVSPRARTSRGSHKGTTWAAALGDPDESPVRVGLAFRGPFARSLVQSLIVEPALAVAISGAALVPAAGIVTGEASLLLAGASRSGKSTLAMRAWSGGRRLLGDDRVLLSPDGTVRPFPRRLRLYPDLSATAPRAYARLSARTRRSLRIASIVRRLTAGWIGLPVLANWEPFLVRPMESAKLGRISVIERNAGEREMNSVDGIDAALGRLAGVIREDLAVVSSHDPAWADAALLVEARTLEVIRSAAIATGARAGVTVVPRQWDAATALAAVEHELGMEA